MQFINANEKKHSTHGAGFAFFHFNILIMLMKLVTRDFQESKT